VIYALIEQKTIAHAIGVSILVTAQSNALPMRMIASRVFAFPAEEFLFSRHEFILAPFLFLLEMIVLRFRFLEMQETTKIQRGNLG
jgi:hypothetical protein